MNTSNLYQGKHCFNSITNIYHVTIINYNVLYIIKLCDFVYISYFCDLFK